MNSHHPPRAVIQAIEAMARPLIAGHVRPDADCLGSILSLASTLGGLPGRVPCVFYHPDQISQRLAFLLKLIPAKYADEKTLEQIDGLIVLDTAHASRAGTPLPPNVCLERNIPVVNIDHHVANPSFGSFNWIEPDASSTSEMIHHLLSAMNLHASPEVASVLYAGIHTDTHGFSLPNTTASSLHAAAELVDRGANITDICERLLRSQAKSEFDLAGIVYENTKVTPDGDIAYSTVDYDEITETGCTAADIDDQVSIPRALNGIKMAILFSEGKPGRIRLNVRGEGGISVLNLAKAYGGGGHANAAGAIIDGEMDAVVQDVLTKAADYLKTQSVT